MQCHEREGGRETMSKSLAVLGSLQGIGASHGIGVKSDALVHWSWEITDVVTVDLM